MEWPCGAIAVSAIAVASSILILTAVLLRSLLLLNSAVKEIKKIVSLAKPSAEGLGNLLQSLSFLKAFKKAPSEKKEGEQPESSQAIQLVLQGSLLAFALWKILKKGS